MEEPFLAKVLSGGRISLPLSIRKKSHLNVGNFVTVQFNDETGEIIVYPVQIVKRGINKK